MATQTLPNQPETKDKKTTVGSYFISNYPPFSFWQADRMDWFEEAINTPSSQEVPLGLYLHIPFCRRRCHFCYFKVYTDKNAKQIRSYIDAIDKELSFYADKPFLQNRKPTLLYFGGGTPSYLSPKQLNELFDNMQKYLSWDAMQELSFECEPGTLTGDKLKVLRDLGITRLSLGIENYDDEILELNGRAHRSPEIFKSYEQARELGFPSINIDLIAGMLGETHENWLRCIDQTLELQPDIVTLYQMEIPFNTTIYKDMKEKNQSIAPVADWETKRQWVSEAFERLESSGYEQTSAYTAVKRDVPCEFLYRDCLWQGSDLLALGVSSFGHINGTHYQNEKDFEPYMNAVEEGRMPIRRALKLREEEKIIREFILQLKKGGVNKHYFADKFQIDILDHFAEPLRRIEEDSLLAIGENEVTLTREGLLRVDSLLPNFYLSEHQGARYT